MVYHRPGVVVYVDSADVALVHGAPVHENGVSGVALKTQTYPWTAGYGGSPSPQVGIKAGEKYTILAKGIVQVPLVSTAVKGDPIYITTGNALTKTAGANKKFGMVVEIGGQRGTPTGKMRVNLDLKDSL